MDEFEQEDELVASACGIDAVVFAAIKQAMDFAAKKAARKARLECTEICERIMRDMDRQNWTAQACLEAIRDTILSDE